MNVDIDVSIVLSWALLNWSIVVDDVLGEEADDSSVAAVAPMGTSLHEWLRCTTVLFENGEVSWNIHLDITAAALVIGPNHGHNALVVTVWILVVSIHFVSSLREGACMALGDSRSGGDSLLIA